MKIINESVLFKGLLESITQKYKIMLTTNIHNILLKEESYFETWARFFCCTPERKIIAVRNGGAMHLRRATGTIFAFAECRR